MAITLKAARINKGYNQKTAAKMLGISEWTLSNYERGLSYPDIPTLKKIEDEFEKSPEIDYIINFIRNSERGIIK